MKIPLISLCIAVIAGCATSPLAPRVAVMPSPGKPFEVFAGEDRECRSYAEQSLGPDAANAGADRFAGSAVLGTVIGAAAGAALGGHDSAGAGAASGLVVGSAAGSQASAEATRDVQARYDIAYQQCMYAKGNQLPGYGVRPQQAPIYPPPGSPPPRQ